QPTSVPTSKPPASPTPVRPGTGSETGGKAALVYSKDPGRSGGAPLQGATVSGQVSVWAAPGDDLHRVTFYMDDQTMSGSPVRIQNIGTLDLPGTHRDGSSHSFSLARSGEH